MKIVNNIVGGLLGLAFIAFSLMVLLHLGPTPPPPPAGSPVAMFMGVFAPTGWLTFVKTCELIGGILVAIPLTRNVGLLFLCPIILNILAFHILVEKAEAFPIPFILALMAAYLILAARKQFNGLLNR